MYINPDNLETVGVNELFVVVTVDVSFTTEQSVVGHIFEIHILNTVRSAPGTLEDFLTKVEVCLLLSVWERLPSFFDSPSHRGGIFFGKFIFFVEFTTNTGESSMSDTLSPIPVNRRCLIHSRSVTSVISVLLVLTIRISVYRHKWETRTVRTHRTKPCPTMCPNH
jgi:hypothetical protein